MLHAIMDDNVGRSYITETNNKKLVYTDLGCVGNAMTLYKTLKDKCTIK